MTVRRRTASHEVSAALLNAAEIVLDRDGTEGVTVRAVAHEAAVSPMSVYNRFESKEGLVVALAARALDELADAVDAARDDSPEARFRTACRNYRDFALQHPARYSLIFGAGSPLQDQSSAVAASGRTIFDVLVSLTEAVCEQRGPAEAAQAVWSAVHGAVTIQHAGIGQTPDADASFDSLLDLLVAGLRGKR